MAIEIPSNINSVTPRNSFKDMLINKTSKLNKCYNHFADKDPMLHSKEEELIQLSDKKKVRYTDLGNSQ